MTVSTEVNKVEIAGNGVATVHSFSPVVIFDADDLEVYLRDPDGVQTGPLVRGTGSTNYSVSVTEYPSTGSITYPASGGTPLPTGWSMAINRKLDTLQETRLASYGPYNAKVQETALDRIHMLVQQQQEEIDRSVKVSITSPTDPDELIDNLLSVEAEAEAAAAAAVAAQAAAEAAQAAAEAVAAGLAQANETQAGIAEIATQAEVDAGADDARIVTANKLATYVAAQLAALNLFQPGFALPFFGSAAPTGWILWTEGSIGNAASSATIRANADTEDLFTALWNTCDDTAAPVSSGRGASAAADFAANKRITLPLGPGRSIGVSGAGAGLTTRAAGASVGAETHTLTESEMPSHGHPYRRATTDISGASGGILMGTTSEVSYPAYDGVVSGTNGQQIGGTGGDAAHDNMQPTTFVPWIIKL